MPEQKRPIGVIAEDRTDLDTMRVIIQRILGPNTGVKGKPGGGCARARRKAGAWLTIMANKGIRRVVILHDLDRNPNNGALNCHSSLRRTLERIRVPPNINRYICIPVEELEAWFWSCETTLSSVAGKPTSAAHHPENIIQPKEALYRLSRRGRGSRVSHYSTNDNPRLAQSLDLDACAQRCASFEGLRDFLLEHNQV